MSTSSTTTVDTARVAPDHHHHPEKDHAPTSRPPLSTILPPIILGTATFNSQYVFDPATLPARPIVARALALGIRAFDTSPYYGPAEELLGDALAAAAAPRDSYLLISKAGRVGPTTFDYSPAAIIASVHRSLERLRTPHLDLAYLHDVEFVTTAEVLAGLGALAALQRRGLVRYIGISGYPVPRLLELAEAAAAAGGAPPLDAVLSYANLTVQNTTLGAPDTLRRFRRAGVDVVLNASILGMGLLTAGISAGPQQAWHPAPQGLRRACVALRDACAARGRRLEKVAIAFALAEWGRAAVDAAVAVAHPPVGATVVGVTTVDELEETVETWNAVSRDLGLVAADPSSDNGAAPKSDDVVRFVKEELWPILGEWKDYAWDSPPKGWFDGERVDKES